MIAGGQASGEHGLVLNPLARSSYRYDEDVQRAGKGWMVQPKDFLGQQRLERAEEVKRERLPLKAGITALHHRRHAFQAEIHGGFVQPE